MKCEFVVRIAVNCVQRCKGCATRDKKNGAE
jgi:hypothetical protein